MTKKFCDKCGVELVGPLFKVNIESNNWIYADGFDIDGDYDLCYDCVRKIVKYIRSPSDKSDPIGEK